MSCSGIIEVWRRQSGLQEAKLKRILFSHGFIVYCKHCRLLLGSYVSLSSVPFMVACPVCGSSSKAKFQKSFNRMGQVTVTSVRSKLGHQLLSMLEQGLIKTISK